MSVQTNFKVLLHNSKGEQNTEVISTISLLPVNLL